MQTAIDSATPSAPITSASDPSNNQAAAIADEEQKQLIDFQTARIYLQSLVTRWKDEEQRTEANRLTRDIEFNIDALRETGDIDDDECFIPERIIDGNIQREMPSYINYLKNSRRISTFTDIVDDTFDTDRLEQQFTKVMTYKGWTKPHFKVVDGAATHAWACVEVMYDERYPGHCCIEYIAHEDLIFPMDAKDLQACGDLIRRYKLSPLQLKAFVANFGFSQEQVNYVLEKRRSSKQDKDKTCLVYKRMKKFNSAVYASWFTIEEGATDWLKSPVKLYAGIDEQKMVITQQPQQIPHYDSMGQQVGITTQMVEVPQQKWIPVYI